MKAPDARTRVVILVEREEAYISWWCRACRYGDGFESGVGRVLESVDVHVNGSHRDDLVTLNIPQQLLTSRVWHFESTPKCTCAWSSWSDRVVCDNCNGVVSR